MSSKSAEKSRRSIRVNHLARVEGEGGLRITVRGGVVTDVQLRIFEPPRYFEAFLRGRRFDEAPDITARVCGICPVAYQMSAVHAMESALGVTVDGPLRALRRLLYCGEWIESHVLHVFMLHAPDFLGYEDAIQMAKDHPEVVKRALRMKRVGNGIVALLGGREIHPINVRVGGFHRAPTKRELASLAEELAWTRDAAIESVEWAAALPFPELRRDHEFVGLRHPGEYPLCEGRVVSNRGTDIALSEFRDHFEERHVAHSTALHGHHRARGPYFVGPTARLALNADRLTDAAREAAELVGVAETISNPFRSILARCVETVWACEEALRIIEDYEMPDAPAVATEPRAGVGHGCSEAPRGILYHRYELDEGGIIRDATIVPPTAQNLPTIEEDLRHFVPRHLHLGDEDLKWRCEQAIRNYDPCISCSAHFLNLTVERR